MTNNCPLISDLKEETEKDAGLCCFKALFYIKAEVKGHDSGSRRGRTGRMRFPNEESWVMKKPVECACACCRAAFCWAAMCCCSALSLKSFILGLDSEMLAPGVFMDWFCISRLLSFSSSARIATRALFWKACPGGLVAMSVKAARGRWG